LYTPLAKPVGRALASTIGKQDPIWNAKFEFDVGDADELHHEIKFHVYDYDKVRLEQLGAD
jgi:hypothetical protein